MENFTHLQLPEALLHTLQKINFTKPTPIQAAAIPFALKGRDIMGSAQTGTGKTGAFSIPMIAQMMKDKNGTALIMSPTRELATQILENVQKMLPPSSGIKTALLIGGQSMFKQLQQLRARPRIIIGTPGRINDHLGQRSVDFSNTKFLVLDETDRMLDMGFETQIEKIIRLMPKQRQTMMFSATLPPYIVKLSEKYLNNPERVAVGSTHAPIERIKQEQLHMTVADKYNVLLEQLGSRKGSVILFVKTKHGADKMAKRLNTAGHSAEAIHGNLNQNQRNRVIQAFRDKKHRIMVATDVAARGLDIPHIEHVINYDLPQVPEDYIHRIGRTARAGAEGSAVCFLTPEDREKWREIHFLMNPGEKPAKPERNYAEGKTPAAKKRRYGNSNGNPHSKARGNSFAANRVARKERAQENDSRPQSQSRQDRPRSDRPYGDRPRNDRAYGDRPRNDRPREERAYGDRPRGDRPAGKPWENRSRDQKRGDRNRSFKKHRAA